MPIYKIEHAQNRGGVSHEQFAVTDLHGNLLRRILRFPIPRPIDPGPAAYSVLFSVNAGLLHDKPRE